MALTLPVGLTPPEIAFLCEMELVTVIPRQRLESINLLAVHDPVLCNAAIEHKPPTRTAIPLYLAQLLHRQRRADILPPPWLSPASLTSILDFELNHADTFSPSAPWLAQSHEDPFGEAVVSPPFQHTSTTEAGEGFLPYHWLEMGEMLLAMLGNDMANAGQVRGLLRDLREVRQSKLRAGMRELKGGGIVSLRGVGAMEVCAERGFVVSVVDGLRVLGASRETGRREREQEGRGEEDVPDDDEMDL